MVWPTLGSRTAEEQNSYENCFAAIQLENELPSIKDRGQTDRCYQHC